jgi:hypothetical protein
MDELSDVTSIRVRRQDDGTDAWEVTIVGRASRQTLKTKGTGRDYDGALVEAIDKYQTHKRLREGAQHGQGPAANEE